MLKSFLFPIRTLSPRVSSPLFFRALSTERKKHIDKQLDSKKNHISDLDALPIAVTANPEILREDPSLLPLIAADPKLSASIGLAKKIATLFFSDAPAQKDSGWSSSNDFDSGYRSN